MSIHQDHADIDSKKTRGGLARIGAVAATTLFALSLSTALAAQDADVEEGEHYEWEADEGIHEEEWYDPSDWWDDDFDNIDDRMTIDYEDDDWDWTYNYDFDGYYDGYYDGYNDDDFGYDYWEQDWDTDYSSTYTDGYYDGFYDAQQEYDYDPNYYVYVETQTEADRKSDEQRAKDRMRKRGDRASAMTKQKDRRAMRHDRQQREFQSARTRVRGTVKQMSQVEDARAEGHTVMNVQFDDGREVVVDFGPKVNRNNLPLKKGQRTTLIGHRQERGDRAVLVASKVQAGGKTAQLRTERRQMERNRQQDGRTGDRSPQRDRDRDKSRSGSGR